MTTKRSKSSERWLARQRKDPFAKKAATQGRVSRAYYKLEQLDERFGLLRPGMRVLELGAAPGGWTRYVESRIGGRRGRSATGLLVAVDFRAVNAAADTVVIRGTLGTRETAGKIAAALENSRVDLVLSDMAPNITGIRASDQALAMELLELAVVAAQTWLKPGGGFVVKVFQGEGIDGWVRDMRKIFAKFKLVKPPASRPDSREMYAVGSQFRAPAQFLGDS
ncbi:MAG: RlmE family RNA methyltransferase [Pseudomonadales bacterium]